MTHRAAMPSTTVRAAPRPASEEVRPRMSLEKLEAFNRVNDRILAGATLLFGFWLASFPIGNSDVFRSLATGRLIAEGRFFFGDDPFTYAAAMHAEQTGQPKPVWIHSSWLFDWLVYHTYLLLGGGGLVLLRGALVAVLVGLMVAMRQRHAGLIYSVMFGGLAALVISGWLSFRSDLISPVLLALTLYLLVHVPTAAKRRPWSKLTAVTCGRPWIFLPLVFAIWANLDRWFLLGPACVAAYLLGQGVQRLLAARRLVDRQPSLAQEDGLTARELVVLGSVLAASLAACLINPYGAANFRNPVGDRAAPALQAFQRADPAYETVGKSGWFQPAYSDGFRMGGRSIAEWACFPLLFFSILTFVLNWRQFRIWRLLLLAGGLACVGWGNAVGVFAVTAAVVAALNLRDFAAGRTETSSLRPRVLAHAPSRYVFVSAQVGRLAYLSVILLLGVLMVVPLEAAPASTGVPRGGMVHGGGSIGWSIFEDPSLRQSARTLGKWRQEGALTGNGFNLHRLFPLSQMTPETPSRPGVERRESAEGGFLQPELAIRWAQTADYWAWYGEGQRAFMDGRFALHSETAEDFLRAGLALCSVGRKPRFRPGQEWRDACAAADEPWQNLFTRYEISHLVVSGDLAVPWYDSSGKFLGPTPLVDLLIEDRNRDGQPQWSLLRYDDGKTFVFAWTGSRAWRENARLRSMEFNETGEVFGRTEDGRPYDGPSQPPPFSGPQSPRTFDWLARFLQGAGQARPLALERSYWYGSRFNIGFQNYQVGYEFAYSRHRMMAQLINAGLATVGGFPAPATRTQREVSLARPFLAIQAARQAIAEQPDDPGGYASLVRAYALMEPTEAIIFNIREARNPIREMQILAALYQLQQVGLLPGLSRNPNFDMHPADVHGHLTSTYLRNYRERRSCLDLALLHYERYLNESMGRIRLPPDLPREEAKLRLMQFATSQFGISIDDLRKGVEEAQKQVQSAGGPPLEQAVRALQNGLTLQARQELELLAQRTKPDTAGHFEIFRHLAIVYAQTGDARSLLRLLQAEIAERVLGTANYHEMMIQASAAVGDYQTALQHLEATDERLRFIAANQARLAFQLQILGSRPGPGRQHSQIEMLENTSQAFVRSAERATRLCWAGVLYLEAGKPTPAAECFRRAIRDLDPNCPQRYLAYRYYYLITGESLVDE